MALEVLVPVLEFNCSKMTLSHAQLTASDSRHDENPSQSVFPQDFKFSFGASGLAAFQVWSA